MSNRKILTITYGEVILAIVRLWKVKVIKACSHMISGCTVSKPRLILSDASVRCCCHCCKFCRRMLALICIVHMMIAINGEVPSFP